jgi:hypothetical protein
MLHYQAVQFLPGMTEQMVPYVFANGLNNASTMEHVKLKLHEDETISIDALVDIAEQFERGASMFQLIDRSRGIITGSSSHTTAGGEAGSILQQLQQQKSAQLEQLRQSSPGEHKVNQLGFELAAVEADNPHAVCLRCPVRARLHLEHQCTAKAKDSDANTPTAAAALTTSMKPLNTESGSGGKSVSFGSVSYGAAGHSPPPFRAPPKPESSGRRGKRSLGFSDRTQQSCGDSKTAGGSKPCSVCHYEQGHGSGVCYFEQPDKANPSWPAQLAPQIHYCCII